MPTDRMPIVSPSRRGLLRLGAAALGTAVLLHAGAALASARLIDVTNWSANPSLNASTQSPDNGPAFNAALAYLDALGGGELTVPPGDYVFTTPVALSSKCSSISITGSGSALSVFIIRHARTAFSFAYSYAGDLQQVVFRNVGLSPSPGGSTGGTALDITFPLPNGRSSGWQAAIVENVDFGVQTPGYSSFGTAISLTNNFRAYVHNCNMHAASGNAGTFAALNGLCIDCRFTNCSMDGVAVGFSVNSYCEGLHIVDCVVIGGVGLQTGTASYSGDGKTTPLINLLALYISGCEFNCAATALSLFQVNQGWITSSHFGGGGGGYAVTCYYLGTCLVQMSACEITGAGYAVNTQGIYVASTDGGAWNSASNQFDDCQFCGLVTGIDLAAGSTNNTGQGMRMVAPGGSSMVGAPMEDGNVTLQAVTDNSGNMSNEIQHIASTTAPRHFTNRFLYLH